jgi:hypothetical protein
MENKRNISITPCRKKGWDLLFRAVGRKHAPAFPALPPSMAVENRDVLSELMTYMEVLMSPEAGCRKRPGMYSRVPERRVPTLHRLNQYTDFLRRYE